MGGLVFRPSPQIQIVGRDERRTPLKTPAWEASKGPQFKGRGTGELQAINFPAGYNRRNFLKVLYSVTERLAFVRLSVGILYSVTDVEGLKVINHPKCNKVLNVITFCPKCNKLLSCKLR